MNQLLFYSGQFSKFKGPARQEILPTWNSNSIFWNRSSYIRKLKRSRFESAVTILKTSCMTDEEKSAEKHFVRLIPGCTITSASTCSRVGSKMLSARHSLNQPSQVLWLFGQRGGMVSSSLSHYFLSQNAQWELIFNVAFRCVHDIAISTTVIFTHRDVNRGVVFLSVLWLKY